MNQKSQSTQLLDGLNFETAVHLYHALLERTEQVEGRAPNLFERQWKESDEAYNLRQNRAIDSDGYALEYFDVIGFRFSKGTGKYGYYVEFVPSDFFQVTNSKRYIGSFDLRGATTAAEVAEVGFQYLLGVELNSMLPQEGDYRVEVRNVNGEWDSFHRGFAKSLGEAIRIKRDLEDGIAASERGNAFCEAKVTLYGDNYSELGYIWIPPFGDITFVPTRKNFRYEGRWTPGLSSETAEKLIWRHREEEAEIAKMWPYIVRHSRRMKWDDPTEFEFENVRYGIDRGSSTIGDPRSSHITAGYRCGVGVVKAYRIGLLEAWARHYGYNG